MQKDGHVPPLMPIRQALRKLVRKKPTVPNMALLTAFQLFQYFLAARDVAHKWRLVGSLRRSKRSHRLFLLGSGASLNALEPRHWDLIRSHDTVGLGCSCFLDVHHNYYFFEHPRKLCDEKSVMLERWITRRRQEGKIENVVWKAIWKVARPLDNQIGIQDYICIPDIGVYFNDIAVQEKFTRFVFRCGLHRMFFIQSRASIFGIAAVGAALGYKEVIFVGVDLSGPYFFHDAARYPEFVEFTTIDKARRKDRYGDERDAHITADPKAGVSVVDSIRILRDLSPATRFFNASPGSKLEAVLDPFDLSR